MTIHDDEISVDDSASPRIVLDTVLHEALHALLPDWPEDKIQHLASQLARFVWRFGIRVA